MDADIPKVGREVRGSERNADVAAGRAHAAGRNHAAGCGGGGAGNGKALVADRCLHRGPEPEAVPAYRGQTA